MKLRGFDTTRAQLGWVCDTCFMVTTANQFSAEEHVVRTTAKTLPAAMLCGWLLAKKTAWLLAAKPGEREAKGWL